MGDVMRLVVWVETKESTRHFRHAPVMSQQELDADNKMQARFQVRKTLAAAKAA